MGDRRAMPGPVNKRHLAHSRAARQVRRQVQSASAFALIEPRRNRMRRWRRKVRRSRTRQRWQ